MKATREEQIRKRAYEIWEQEGRPHGEDLKHWLKAFEEIGSRPQSTAKQSGSKADKRAKTVAEARKPASGVAATDRKPSKDKRTLEPEHQSSASNATVPEMPAKSKAQQTASGAALSAKRGETSKNKVKGASKSTEKSMSEKQPEEFASTKTKGKPERVSK